MARKKNKISGDINIVPYIDVMLVLLVIFMITTPLMEQGVDVDLPKTANNSDVKDIDNKEVFLVSIKSDKKIHVSFNGDTILVDKEELINNAQQFRADVPSSKAFLKSDENVNYGFVIDVMDSLKGVGYEKVGLITEKK